MSSWTIRAATEQDLSAIVDLLNEKAAQLAARGISQWAPGWMTKDRMLPMIRRGETWVGRNDAELVVTVSLSTQADPDFWTSEEQKVPALYLNKLASRESGAGAMAIEWARKHAGKLGYPVLRLDAWATNEALHAYYRRHGWTHLRTMHVPGRRSGALFEIPTRRPTQRGDVYANCDSENMCA